MDTTMLNVEHDEKREFGRHTRVPWHCDQDNVGFPTATSTARDNDYLLEVNQDEEGRQK